MSSPKLMSLLEGLVEAEVELILVGGLAAVAQGAPTVTMDVDIVPRRTEANVDRLLAFLAAHHARHRARPSGSVLLPNRADLLGPGHSLLMTDLGPVDVLGTIDGGKGFEDLEADTVQLELAGRRVKVLSLAQIVDGKRRSSRAKDQAMLPILEATLARLRGEPKGSG